MSNLALLVDYLIPQDYPPFYDLLQRICPDVELALFRLIALLIFREAASGNDEGVAEAVREMDAMSPHIQSLAQVGHKTQAGRRKGGRKGAETRREAVKVEHQRIVSMAKQLLSQDCKPRQLAGIIAKRTDRTDKTVRRVLQRHGILEKRTRTRRSSL